MLVTVELRAILGGKRQIGQKYNGEKTRRKEGWRERGKKKTTEGGKGEKN